MRVIVTAAAATLTLAACTKADWATPPSAAELVAADQAKCATYGYPVGQPEHEACFKAEIAMRTGVMANPSAGHTDIVAPPPPAEPIPAAPPVPTDWRARPPYQYWPESDTAAALGGRPAPGGVGPVAPQVGNGVRTVRWWLLWPCDRTASDGYHLDRFDAYLGDNLIVVSRQPLYDGARALLDLGANPDALLTIRYAGKDHDSFAPRPIGELAQWMIEESDKGGLKRRRWKPFGPRARWI